MNYYYVLFISYSCWFPFPILHYITAENFSYFHVEFGLRRGFVHIIDNEADNYNNNNNNATHDYDNDNNNSNNNYIDQYHFKNARNVWRSFGRNIVTELLELPSGTEQNMLDGHNIDKKTFARQGRRDNNYNNNSNYASSRAFLQREYEEFVAKFREFDWTLQVEQE